MSLPSFLFRSRWWLATGVLLLACGGRSGELYDDSVTSTSTTQGAGGTRGSGGSQSTGGSGGNGGSAFGGNGGSAFGGNGGSAFGGNGGSAFGGNGGSAFGGDGGSAFGGSAGSAGDGGSGGSGGSAGTGGSGGSGGSAGTGGSGGSGGEPGGPLECVRCLAQQCPAFIECLTDEPCYDGLLCTTENCFDSASPPLCILECHDGDLARVQNLAAILACAVSSCSSGCDFN